MNEEDYVDRTRDRFDKWSEDYESGWRWRRFFLPLHHSLIKRISPRIGERILDLGCGTGAFARRLVGEGATVYGLDLSPGMLEIARERAEGREDLTFNEGAADELPFENEFFDRVVSVISFHHYPDPERSIQEMYRVLRPEGKIHICDPCGEGLASRLILAHARKSSTDEHYYSREELARLLQSSGFITIEPLIVRRLPKTMLVSGTRPAVL